MYDESYWFTQDRYLTQVEGLDLLNRILTWLDPDSLYQSTSAESVVANIHAMETIAVFFWNLRQEIYFNLKEKGNGKEKRK